MLIDCAAGAPDVGATDGGPPAVVALACAVGVGIGVASDVARTDATGGAACDGVEPVDGVALASP